MNAKDLKPVSQLALTSGAKVLLYGPPGTAKTPMVAKLPRAVMCCVEQGLSSVRNDSIPAWCAFTVPRFEEFFLWATTSKETQQFDTIIIDSLTHLANIVLEQAQKRNKDGRAAYGELGRFVMNAVHTFALMPNKNIIFTAQMATEEVPYPNQGFGTEPKTFKYNRPLFPGRVLEKEIPHSIDEILFVNHCQRPDGSFGPAIATTDTGFAMARSRCGTLDPLEPCDLNYLFSKINS